ncbi:MAG: hypothetical protein MJ066_05255, partial [Clostridia bacterium]|nr:hypothetical protein [Clostridia bacterium]
GADYYNVDLDIGLLENLEFQTSLVKKLLENNCESAEEIIKKFVPTFKSKEEYFAFLDSVGKKRDMVIYNEDGTAKINN